MARLDSETIRHALETARRKGFRTVRLRSEDTSLFASLAVEEPEEEEAEAVAVAAVEVTSPLTEVPSPVVGYFRALAPPIEVGAAVEAGQALAEVVALGIANEVVAPVSGEVVEIAVQQDDAVEYGQVLFRLGSGS